MPNAVKECGTHSYDTESSPILIGDCAPILESREWNNVALRASGFATARRVPMTLLSAGRQRVQTSSRLSLARLLTVYPLLSSARFYGVSQVEDARVAHKPETPALPRA